MPGSLPSAADQARAEADTVQARNYFSNIAHDIQRILGGIAGFSRVGADISTQLAEARARDIRRAEQEALRDKAITDRLVDPDTLARHAAAGAKKGVAEALATTIDDLKRQVDTEARERNALLDRFKADYADRRAHEARRHKHDRIRNAAIVAFGLLIPAAYVWGHHHGSAAGEEAAYIRTHDEVTAANWANTPNGKLARRIDRASTATLPMVANCSGERWVKTKSQGRRACLGALDGTGWFIP